MLMNKKREGKIEEKAKEKRRMRMRRKVDGGGETKRKEKKSMVKKMK